MAAQKFVKNHRITRFWLLPCESLEEVIDYVTVGESYGVVPYHNSSAGLVQTPAHFAELYKELEAEEVSMLVHHYLLGVNGVSLQQINTVISHPQALSQCKMYLNSHLPKAVQSVYSTTSTAAKDLANGKLPSDCAVIASKEAAEIYSLKVLVPNIEDHKKNITRFKILKKR